MPKYLQNFKYFQYDPTTRERKEINKSDVTRVECYDAIDEELGIAISSRQTTTTLLPTNEIYSLHDREDQADGARIPILEEKELEDDIEIILFLTGIKIQAQHGEQKAGSTFRGGALKRLTWFDMNLGDSQGFTVRRDEKNASIVHGFNSHIHETLSQIEQKRLKAAGFTPKKSSKTIGSVNLSGSFGDNDSVPYGLTQNPWIVMRTLPEDCSEVMITSDGSFPQPSKYLEPIGTDRLVNLGVDLTSRIVEQTVIKTTKEIDDEIIEEDVYQDDCTCVMATVKKDSPEVRVFFVADGHRKGTVSLAIYQNCFSYIHYFAEVLLEISRQHPSAKPIFVGVIKDFRELGFKLDTFQGYPALPVLRREILLFVSSINKLLNDKTQTTENILQAINKIYFQMIESFFKNAPDVSVFILWKKLDELKGFFQLTASPAVKNLFQQLTLLSYNFLFKGKEKIKFIQEYRELVLQYESHLSQKLFLSLVNTPIAEMDDPIKTEWDRLFKSSNLHIRWAVRYLKKLEFIILHEETIALAILTAKHIDHEFKINDKAKFAEELIGFLRKIYEKYKHLSQTEDICYILLITIKEISGCDSDLLFEIALTKKFFHVNNPNPAKQLFELLVTYRNDNQYSDMRPAISHLLKLIDAYTDEYGKINNLKEFFSKVVETLAPLHNARPREVSALLKYLYLITKILPSQELITPLDWVGMKLSDIKRKCLLDDSIFLALDRLTTEIKDEKLQYAVREDFINVCDVCLDNNGLKPDKIADFHNLCIQNILKFQDKISCASARAFIVKMQSVTLEPFPFSTYELFKDPPFTPEHHAWRHAELERLFRHPLSPVRFLGQCVDNLLQYTETIADKSPEKFIACQRLIQKLFAKLHKIIKDNTLEAVDDATILGIKKCITDEISVFREKKGLGQLNIFSKADSFVFCDKISKALDEVFKAMPRPAIPPPVIARPMAVR